MLRLNMEAIGRVCKLSDDESLLEIDPRYREGMHGMGLGDWVQVSYWMHELRPEDRQTLKVHPRGDRSRPLKGVFALRSPMRPNPIGVSVVQTTSVEENGVVVRGLDALDGSPLVDIKSAMKPGR